MRKLDGFLEKFLGILQEGAATQKYIAEILESQGIKGINPEKITIKGESVFVKVHPSQKSELFLKQGKILALLKANQKTKHIQRVL